MNIDTFNQALELRNKCVICEEVLEYLSDPDAIHGMKYRNTLAYFFKLFKDEMLVFTHELMVKVSMEFEDLHCPEHSETEPPKQPETPPEDAVYKIGDRVKVLDGILKGSVGTVEDYDSETERFGVRLDRFSPDALLQWYDESQIELYKEPEENPDEEEKPIVPYLAEGDTVIVSSGNGADVGKIGTLLWICTDTACVSFEEGVESFVEVCHLDKVEEEVFHVGDKVMVGAGDDTISGKYGVVEKIQGHSIHVLIEDSSYCINSGFLVLVESVSGDNNDNENQDYDEAW